jgi:Tol biopolymer transport system component
MLGSDARPKGSKEAGAIFTVEVGGGEVEKLTDGDGNDSSPAWNPVLARE